MDAAELLKSDHEKIERLFGEIESAEDFFEKQESFQRLKEQLEIHTFLEETHFYPLLESKSEFEGLIEDALDDHSEVTLLLDEIATLDEDPDLFNERLGELIEWVQGHFELEEDEIFPKLKKAFSEEELKQLSVVLEEAKKSTERAA